MKLVTWNIEKGKRWALLQQCFSHPSISAADILCLNEVDEGMARSGNLRIAHEIGDRLGMQVIFGKAFKEFTKGIGDDELLAPGDNTTAIQGNAILTRLPILSSENLLLPACFDHSKRIEKRDGNRHALIARFDCGQGRTVTVANAHLEVFGTARCRAVQMRFLLERLGEGPAIVTGDFNSNTFSRGSAWHIGRSVAVLAFTNARARVAAPWRHEPLFNELRSAGFLWQSFNDDKPTCSVELASLEDRVRAPAFVRRLILGRYSVLPLRLDFICCRGLKAATPGHTITDLPCQPSDHLPITCDLVL